MLILNSLLVHPPAIKWKQLSMKVILKVYIYLKIYLLLYTERIAITIVVNISCMNI